MKVLLYNIGHATGISKGYHEYITKGARYVLTNGAAIAELASFIKKIRADIVFLIEIKRGKGGQFDLLRSQLNYQHAIFFSKYTPKVQQLPFMKNGGCAVFSRRHITSERVELFSKGLKRAFLSVKLSKNVRLICAHLSLGEKTRKVQLKELAEYVSQEKTKTILLGDLNTLKSSKEVAPLLKAGLINSNTKNKPTFPSWSPVKELDYILLSKGIKVKSCKVLSSNLSDHLPLLVECDV